ncbi:putative toxin-antitoxin system toxin component, PIN family, partial [Desulfococcus sp.]|uniref:putative toxin-antitoxin system toxin component, PIN family n=1 Tax=Desulfococcus sp. TaxID=2025834 RepID=UPI0035935250
SGRGGGKKGGGQRNPGGKPEMIRAVIDTHVFVSPLLTPGSNASAILDWVRADKVGLLVSRSILAEIERVLQYPKLAERHRMSPRQIREFLNAYAEIAQMTEERTAVRRVQGNPAGDKYLACAVEGGADFIISADHHLTELKTYRGIRIVTPADFVELIKAKE